MLKFIGTVTDSPYDPETDGPRLLRELVSTREDGAKLFFTVFDVHYSTLGICELIGITPRELTERALGAGLIHYDRARGLQAGPLHLGQGFEEDGEEIPPGFHRKRNISDAFWPPDCFEFLGLFLGD